MRFCGFKQSVEKTASAANLKAQRDINGVYRITSNENDSFVGTAMNAKEAVEKLKQFINHNAPDIDGNLPFPTSGGQPLAPGRIKPNDVLKPGREFIQSMQAGPLAFLTPIKTVFQAQENAGFGKAWSVVYQKSQQALGEVGIILAKTKRAALGDITFDQAIKGIEKRVANLANPAEKELITLRGEAFTKPEIEAHFEMNPAELAASKAMEDLHQEHNIPNLIRRNAVIDEFLNNRANFLTKDYPTLRNAILEQRLPPEFLPEIEKLKLSAGTEETWTDVAKTMQLSDDEIQAMKNLRVMNSKSGKDVFNIPAIYRHATAPDLLDGFANGREQFDSRVGLSKEAQLISNDRMKILEEAFNVNGFQGKAERVLGVELPIFRQFIDSGLMPGKQFPNALSGEAAEWAKVLDKLDTGNDILSRRVLSGHLNPHELDPAISASKHIRNLALRQTLDPLMPELLDEAHNISLSDPRSGKIAYNYLHEVQGVPTEGMQNATAMLRTVGRFLGVPVDDRIAERLVRNMNYLTSSASIPFRAALILRNSYQMTMGIPIVGARAWVRGLEAATGFEGGSFSVSLANEAWDRAYAAQALKPEIVPLHGGETFSEAGSAGLSRLPGFLAKIGFQGKEAVDWAFSKYRSMDDIGRVVQFEAGRTRAMEQIARFKTGEISLDELMKSSKALTFNEAVQAQFKSMVTGSSPSDGADLLGKELADKVHFNYGEANHPVGWGGVAGKLLGQFGTFPVQYASHLIEGLSQGTASDRWGFLAAHSAINMGVIAAGASVGLNLESWAFAPSLHYTGGPYAGLMLSGVMMWGGSDAEKAMAKRNIQMMMPSLSHPSIFVPTSYFWHDWASAYNSQDSIGGFLAQATGFKFVDPNPKRQDWVQKGFGWVLETLQ